MADNRKTVVVGMSGGVDSSVAALLLKKDFNVIGVSLQVFDYSSFQDCDLKGVCCSPEDVYDARKVAERLDIPFYVLNYREKFYNLVIKNFISEYLSGRTPNPCIICNEKIKFGEMLNFAKSVGADFVATGHYAINETNGISNILKMGKDRHKDQSYFLYRLSQNQLKNILFPIGNLTKEKVREIARENNLEVYRKRESHEICFVPDNNYSELIAKNSKGEMDGRIIRSDGKILGRHNGFYKYTIGQRRGLNISADKPLYVVSINPSMREVIVGYESELYSTSFITEHNNIIYANIDIEKIQNLKVKIRYLSEAQDCIVISSDKKRLIVKTSVPLRSVTPGQSAVFYLNDIVVGGGIITEILK